MYYPFNHILIRSPLRSLRYVNEQEQLMLFQEGLYLSSPELYNEYTKQREQETVDEKMALSLAKYMRRSATRCTPYGTFAGSTLAKLGTETSLILSDPIEYQRKLRIDMNYMMELVASLMKIPGLCEQIVFYPNNSLYQVADAVRYVEYSILNNTRHYQLTAVPLSGYIQEVLDLAREGTTMGCIVEQLVTKHHILPGEARDFADQLCSSQLLVPALEPSITGAEPLTQIMQLLSGLSGTEKIVAGLKEIAELIERPEEGVGYYKKIEARLKSLELVSYIPKNTLQVDLCLTAKEAVVDQDLVNEAVRQALDLTCLARIARNAELAEFKKQFLSRYENAQVPLALALDADLGIGYAGASNRSAAENEWINGLAVGGAMGQSEMSVMDYIQQYAVTKYQAWLANKDELIRLEETELAAFKKQTERFRFPNSMYLMGSLMKNGDVLDAENFLFDVRSFGGPSAGNLLGRFTHGDEQLCELTREILKKEEQENTDAIYAEIVHLPQARIGNILLRPVLRQYEIPYIGRSGVEKDKQITIDDLLISVENNEIVLRSKRLRKRIIPRLTTAHNFGVNALPAYKFLCDLQAQGIAYPNVWDWGQLSVLKHLPRVIYKNLILQKATWKLEENDFKDLPEDKSKYDSFFKELRHKLSIPQKVVYKEGDNELLIDFEDETGIDLFLSYLKKRKNITVGEFLFSEENCVVRDQHGNPFTNEIIIPLYEEAITVEEKQDSHFSSTEANDEANKVQRSFSLYSEWLYFKVYCGAKSAEKLLASTIHDFVEKGIETKLFDEFFFIRYYDESGNHFRIRFKNDAPVKQMSVYASFMESLQPFIDCASVSKVMTDTYNRELERYMPELIEEAETIFFHDSVATLNFLNLLSQVEQPEQYRVLFAIRGIDMLLDDFGLDMAEKSHLAKNIQAGFFREFGAHPDLQKQLNSRYRTYSKLIAEHLDRSKDEINDIEEAVAIFKERSNAIMPVANKIKEKLAVLGKNDILYDLLSSYIHMYMNRLFLAQQRKFELVVYHFLEKYYFSQLARLKKKENALPVL